MPTAAERWAHARVFTDIQAPSGEVYDYEVPDLWLWYSKGLIPNPLLSIATKVEMEGIGIDELREDPEMSKDFFELICWVIATHLRKPNLIEEEGSEEAAVEVVKTKMHPHDRQLLIRYSLHFWNRQEIGKEVAASLQDAVPFLDQFANGVHPASNRRERRAAKRQARDGVSVLRPLHGRGPGVPTGGD